MYDFPYYAGFRDGSRKSAQAVVPLIMDWAAPASVLDLGCGVGDWLSVFKRAGVREIHGVDGDYVRGEELAISEREFTAHDLTIPYPAGRRYDLAMSLEVGEHLPAESAACLVYSLAAAAPLVLFSAAVPNQPGKAHINCQWPAYWADLFAENGYVVIDALRFRVWNDSSVDWWYRQNLMIYACEKQLDRWPKLKPMRDPKLGSPLPLVHPEMFRQFHQYLFEWGAEWERKYWEAWEQERRRASA
jgi:SAM-dependent methyltransferase